ncbi:MAG: lactate utilization protein [Angelakisella sp.]
MNEYLKASIINRLESAKKALEKNRMETFLVADCNELTDRLRAMIPAGAVLCSGGSMTLEETGVTRLLSEPCYDFYSRGRLDAAGQPVDVLRKAFSADWYFSSSNAITLDGELYNVDGNANRVAAISFGPKKVVIIAGYNKIVRNLEEAAERVRAIAAPANCVRLGKKNGCQLTGHCVNCHSADRICCTATVHSFQRDPERIKVFLLPMELGY